MLSPARVVCLFGLAIDCTWLKHSIPPNFLTRLITAAADAISLPSPLGGTIFLKNIGEEKADVSSDKCCS